MKDQESDSDATGKAIATEKVNIEAQPTAKTAGPPPPPNGGLLAWMQVLGAFFLNFDTWGLINTFGIFQSEYSTGFLSNSSNSAISWIGSIQAFLMLFSCVLSGRLLDAGYFYTDITIGVFLQVFGMMSEFSSLITNIVQESYLINIQQQ
jgi:hypothetical protein